MPIHPFLKRSWPLLILGSLFLLGIVLRVLPLQARDYWFDEAFTGILVRQTPANMMDIILHDVHPPLYYFLLKGWAAFFGSTALALRSFSIFFGMMMIATVGWMVREWQPKTWWPSILTTGILAVNPFFVNYSQETRMYAFLGFLLVLCMRFFVASKQHPSIGKRIAYGTLLLAIFLTHYIGAVFILGFFLADLWMEQKTILAKKWNALLSWAASGYLIPLLGALCWLPSFLFQRSVHASLGWVPDATLSAIPTSLHIFLFGAPVGVMGVPPALGYRTDLLQVSSISLVLFACIVIIATVLTLKKRWDLPTALCGFFALFPLLTTLALQRAHLQLYVERFLTGSGIFLVLWITLSLMRLSRPIFARVAIVIYIGLILLVQPWHNTSTFPIIKTTIEQSSPQKLIVIASPIDFTIMRFYLGESSLSHLRVYNGDHPSESLAGWAIIPAENQLFALPKESHLLLTTRPEPFPEYATLVHIGNQTLLQSL